MFKNNTKSRNNGGFTIIEAIVAVVIIGILLSIGVASFTNSQNRAKKEEAIAVAEKVKLTLGTYYSERDRYPRDHATVVSYLTTKGDSETATEFSNTTNFTYQGTTAGGGNCAETGANKCERYTITVNRAAWNGIASEPNEVITP